MSKIQKLEAYLEEHGSITNLEIAKICRTTTPSKVASLYRAKIAPEGKTFNGSWEQYVNDEGRTVRYMRFAKGEAMS